MFKNIKFQGRRVKIPRGAAAVKVPACFMSLTEPLGKKRPEFTVKRGFSWEGAKQSDDA
jgi:hypothetical protein